MVAIYTSPFVFQTLCSWLEFWCHWRGLQFCWVSGSQLCCHRVILSGNKVASSPWERGKTIDFWRKKHILNSGVGFWQRTISFLIVFVMVAMRKIVRIAWAVKRKERLKYREGYSESWARRERYFEIIHCNNLGFFRSLRVHMIKI